jgi:two-component system cell cycle sensor histidine kinase/response regulator CckA
MWLMDPATLEFIEANQAAVELYGYTHDEFLSMTAADIRPTEDVPFLKEQVQVGESLRGVLTRHEKKNGDLLWVEVAFRPIEWEGRRLHLAVAFDVTARTEATEAVERLRRFYEDILENIDVDIAVLDPELRFEYVNRASVPDPELRSWLVGRTNRDYVEARGKPVELAERREAAIRSAVEGRARHEEVEQILDCEGEVRHVVRSHLPLFDDDGHLRRILGYGFDRTEQIETEAALRAREAQLHQAQRMVATGRLAGGIAHDFNNLLTAVRGHVELLLEEDWGDADAHDSLLEIRFAADRAAQLVRHLLTLGRRNLRLPEVVDLNELLESRRNVLRRVLSANIDLDLRLCTKPARIFADPSEMEQVLLNLVFNARDAMPEGGRLSLVTGSEQSANGSGTVTLRVDDSGEGMDEETRSKALEPFFTTRGPGKGTGLGLSVVYSIVTAAGGGLALESLLGEGTTVTVTLPGAWEPAG